MDTMTADISVNGAEPLQSTPDSVIRNRLQQLQREIELMSDERNQIAQHNVQLNQRDQTLMLGIEQRRGAIAELSRLIEPEAAATSAHGATVSGGD